MRTSTAAYPQVYLQQIHLFELNIMSHLHMHALCYVTVGQFFQPGIEIDEARRLLLLPGMEPVAVMRKPVWHFMEREEKEDQFCWVAMNPGYQGKKLIQGHYLDYVVNDVLSDNFKFRPKKH